MDALGKRPNGGGILAILLKDFHHTLIVSGMLGDENKLTMKGFTLIELIIYIAIVSSILIP